MNERIANDIPAIKIIKDAEPIAKRPVETSKSEILINPIFNATSSGQAIFKPCLFSKILR